ncbi:hypothetical protein ABZ714_02200 [Streptomyces sp. NPDC006798]|uniref:hypothetical protein n=1 Tax=Streptomyces sp. NPDC006798 TaxID=3155462 RepID=UPI00340A5657
MRTTHVTGGYDIEPPLPPESAAVTPYGPGVPEAPPYGCDLVLRYDESGSAARLVARRGETYGLLGQVRAAVARFPGHSFTGALHCADRTTGDGWQIAVAGRRVALLRF